MRRVSEGAYPIYILLLAALAAACDDGGSDDDPDSTVDMAMETDGGDDMGPDVDLPDVGPDMRVEPDVGPDIGPDMRVEPDVGPDMRVEPDVGPDMRVEPDVEPVDELILTITSPEHGDLVNQNPLPVIGTLNTFAVVTVNGVEAEVDGDFGWRAEIDAPEGELQIDVTAAGGAGADVVEESLAVTVDLTPPPLRIVRPADGSTVVTDPVPEGDPPPTTEVCVESEPGATVTVLALPVELDEAGAGCVQAPLPRLAFNRMPAVATDAAGNETRAEVFVNRVEGLRDSDEDEDGLSLADELERHGTDPLVADSDEDGLLDGEEVELGTSPVEPDTDGGGRSDGQEVGEDLTDPLDANDDLVRPPVVLVDGGDYRWDIQGDGTVDTGQSVDGNVTFDTGARLNLNGVPMPAQELGVMRQERREVVFGPATRDDLEVTRQAYVPADAQFARFVDVLHNPGDAEVEVEARFTVDLGGFSTEYADDSDADGQLTVDDDWWIAYDDAFAGPRTAVGVIFSDADARAQPAAAQRNGSILDWSFELTVPPGGTVRLMHVLAQHAPGDVAAAQENVQALLAIPNGLVAGLDAEARISIANLDVPPDADLDGLPDAEELERGTDPNNPDTDADGLLDGFEVDFGFDPLTPGEENQDPDEDGLDNLAEQDFGSDPTQADIDRDGLDDAAEQAAGTNPRAADTDRDGLGDGRELDVGTDPLDPDTDDGGRGDGAELHLDGTDPLQAEDDLPPVELTYDLNDGGEFLWDITTSGAISNGSNDAYDTGLTLAVGGRDFPRFDQGFLGADEREVYLGPAPMGRPERRPADLRARRRPVRPLHRGAHQPHR